MLSCSQKAECAALIAKLWPLLLPSWIVCIQPSRPPMSLAAARSVMWRSAALPALRRSSVAAVRPASLPCVAAAAAALPARCWSVAPVLSASAFRRSLHSSSLRCGGHGADDGEFHHGSDFVDRPAVERRVMQLLSEVEKIDKQKLQDSSRQDTHNQRGQAARGSGRVQPCDKAAGLPATTHARIAATTQTGLDCSCEQAQLQFRRASPHLSVAAERRLCGSLFGC